MRVQILDAHPQSAVSPLRVVRQAHGLGLRDVARRANIDPSHLSKAERGLHALSLPALLRVARVLGLRELAAFIEPYVGNDG